MTSMMLETLSGMEGQAERVNSAELVRQGSCFRIRPMVRGRKLMLLADRASYQTQKVVIAAALVGIPLQTHLQEAEEELLLLVPHAKSVVLKIESGHGAPPQYLTRSNVVLRYLASLDEQSQLYGRDLFESARVDQWLDFCFNSVEVPAAALSLARDKVVQVSSAVTAAAHKEVEGTLKVIDAALQNSTFLAGEQVTVADVAVLCALLELLQDKPTLLHHYPVLGRWCLTLLHHPKIAAELPDAKRMIKSVCEGNGNHTAFTPSTQRIEGAQTACKAAGDVRGLAATSGATGTQAAIDGPGTTLFHRDRVLVNEVLAKGSAMVGSEVTVKGWARTIREANKGELIFIELTDGSSARTLQVILTDGKTEGFTEVRPSASGGVGASFSVRGKIVNSPAKGQEVELHGEWVEVVGKVYGGDNGSVGGKLYPLSKKAHSLEYLRTIAHLRPRTRVIGSVVRLRHAMAFATHKFFNDRGFKYIHTPIITAADCEGAGEQFCVTTVLPDGEKQKLPTLSNGMVDYSKDFFGQRTCLTVSGQLNVESFACALSDVYTFGPTFRAENSHTTRHLAEFWMIEPEIAFADLEKDMALAEDYLKYCVWYALTHHDEDLALFEKHPDGEPGLRERLQNVLQNPFHRLTYTDAVQLLQDEIAAGKVKFEVSPTWGCDLGSEHERYITEKVYKKPVIVTNYPKEIKAFYMRLDESGKTVAAMDILVPKIGEIIGGSQREERFDVLVARCEEMGLDPKAVWWYLDLRRSQAQMLYIWHVYGPPKPEILTRGINDISRTIVKGDAPSATVYEDLLVTSFLDINPLADFHTLVIPRRHYSRLDEIDEESAAALGVALKKVARALVRVTGSPDYNILLANGPSAGQEVWHVHYHVIPRTPKDGLGFRWKTQRMPPQTEIDAFLSKMQCELRTAEMGKTVDEALMT